MARKCQAQTRKRRPCPINAEPRPWRGQWLCHVHHPYGTYQRKLAVKRAWRRYHLEDELHTEFAAIVRD